MSVIRLRQARMEDQAFLYRVRTDPETMAQSFSTGAISSEAHRDWLEATLLSRRRLLFVAEEDTIPVGTIRLDISAGTSEAEIAVALAPEARGRGLGALVIDAGVEEAHQRGIGVLVAKIKSGNLKSMRAFEQNDFKAECVEFIRHV